MVDTDAKNAISKIFICLSVCLSVCMFLIETKTTRRILTKLGTIILHTPGQVIVYLGIPTGTGIRKLQQDIAKFPRERELAAKNICMKKSKPRKI